jgi:tyrosine-protein phosphatase YwqE
MPTSTYPDPNVPDVTTTEAQFGDVVDAYDKNRQKQVTTPALTYVFGGRIKKFAPQVDPYA